MVILLNIAYIKRSGRGGGLNMCYVICEGGLAFVLQNVMEGGGRGSKNGQICVT